MEYNIAKDFVASITTMETMLIKATEELDALNKEKLVAVDDKYIEISGKMDAYNAYINKLVGLLIRTTIVTYSNYADIDQINDAAIQNKGLLNGIEVPAGFGGIWAPLYNYKIVKGNILTTCRNLFWENSKDSAVEMLQEIYKQTISSNEKAKILPPRSLMESVKTSFNSHDFELPVYPDYNALFDEETFYAPDGEELTDGKKLPSLPEWLEDIKGDFDETK